MFTKRKGGNNSQKKGKRKGLGGGKSLEFHCHRQQVWSSREPRLNNLLSSVSLGTSHDLVEVQNKGSNGFNLNLPFLFFIVIQCLEPGGQFGTNLNLLRVVFFSKFIFHFSFKKVAIHVGVFHL